MSTREYRGLIGCQVHELPWVKGLPWPVFQFRATYLNFTDQIKLITTKIKIKANKRTLEQVSRRNKGTEGSREITWVLDEANFMLGVRSGTRLAKGGLEPK